MEDEEDVPDVIFPGAVFDGREAFKRVIAYENAEVFRRCYFSENTEESLTARCADRECQYVVRARVRVDGSMHVTSCHVMHSCRMNPGSAPPSVLVHEIALDVLRYSPAANPGDVIAYGRVDHGYAITYMQAYRALAKIRSSYKTANEMSYGLVLPWLLALQRTNPGTIIDVQKDKDGHLLKAFVMLSSWSASLSSCLPVLSLDACHLKCKEGGTLFIASVLSPNRDIVIVAIGVGMIEDREHWEWFCRNVRAGTRLHFEADSVVMSDREKGLNTALETVLPEVPHGYCSFHLKKNVVTHYKTDLQGNIINMAKALTTTEYRELETAGAAISKEAVEYLKEKPRTKWVTCYFPRPRFGMVTTNISESSNSWLLEEREHTWFSCLADIIRKTGKRMHEKRVEYQAVKSPFVPWVEAKVTKKIKLARRRIVIAVTDNVYEVSRNSSPTYATVKLDTSECSCRFWQEHKYPCVHACAAVLAKNKDPLDFISDYYATGRLHQVFEPYALSVDVLHVESDGAKPPVITKRRGRPKKVRIRNRSEFINDDSPIRCSLCNARGHNKRTCERRAKKQKKQ